MRKFLKTFLMIAIFAIVFAIPLTVTGCGESAEDDNAEYYTVTFESVNTKDLKELDDHYGAHQMLGQIQRPNGSVASTIKVKSGTKAKRSANTISFGKTSFKIVPLKGTDLDYKYDFFFDKWEIDTDSWTITQDVTFKAYFDWKKASYEVSFDTNGKQILQNQPANVEWEYGSQLSVPFVSAPGFSLLANVNNSGWSFNKNATTMKQTASAKGSYSPDQELFTEENIETRKIKAYAIWARNCAAINLMHVASDTDMTNKTNKSRGGAAWTDTPIDAVDLYVNGELAYSSSTYGDSFVKQNNKFTFNDIDWFNVDGTKITYQVYIALSTNDSTMRYSGIDITLGDTPEFSGTTKYGANYYLSYIDVELVAGDNITSVSGSGSYLAGQTVTLSATANENCTFEKWFATADGTEAPIQVYVLDEYGEIILDENDQPIKENATATFELKLINPAYIGYTAKATANP